MFQFEMVAMVRKRILQVVDGLTNEQLNFVPSHLNNNLIWHLGHLCVTLSSRIYITHGLPSPIPEWIVTEFKPGTKADKIYTAEQVELIKEIFVQLPQQIVADEAAGKFAEYKSWTTMAGEAITTFSDCLRFMHFHEGLHLGNMQIIKKLLP
jgi:DinB superfamily